MLMATRVNSTKLEDVFFRHMVGNMRNGVLAIGRDGMLVLINDVSLRRLAPIEMATGFGWLHSKPSSSFSLTAVTPDEVGGAWADGKLSLPIRIARGGQPFGEPRDDHQ